MNSTSTCSTWKGMDSVKMYLARNSPYDENKQPYHIGSVAAHGSKDLAFRRTPERRCQECYWCIIKDSWRRQHHHSHMEHKDAKSCKETQELTHKLNRYRWNILGLCEMRWKKLGETTTNEGHKVVFFQWERGQT